MIQLSNVEHEPCLLGGKGFGGPTGCGHSVQNSWTARRPLMNYVAVQHGELLTLVASSLRALRGRKMQKEIGYGRRRMNAVPTTRPQVTVARPLVQHRVTEVCLWQVLSMIATRDLSTICAQGRFGEIEVDMILLNYVLSSEVSSQGACIVGQ